jgi:hypothetical protein
VHGVDPALCEFQRPGFFAARADPAWPTAAPLPSPDEDQAGERDQALAHLQAAW